MNYSCVFPQELTGNDRFQGPKAVTGKTILGSFHLENKINIANSPNLKMLLYK